MTWSKEGDPVQGPALCGSGRWPSVELANWRAITPAGFCTRSDWPGAPVSAPRGGALEERALIDHSSRHRISNRNSLLDKLPVHIICLLSDLSPEVIRRMGLRPCAGYTGASEISQPGPMIRMRNPQQTW